MNRSCNSILCRFGVKKEVYNWDGVESVVATALMHENKVVINANWQLGDKGDKGECFCKDFFQIGVF